MKQDEQFDELARRKLEERSFPFEEADWSAARALIDTERGRSSGVIWPRWALGLLLLAGGLTWYVLADVGTAEQPDKPVASLNVPTTLPEEIQMESEALRTSDTSASSELIVDANRKTNSLEEPRIVPSPATSTYPAEEPTATVQQRATEDVAEPSRTVQALAMDSGPPVTRESDEAASVSDGARVAADRDLVQRTPVSTAPTQGEGNLASGTHTAASVATTAVVGEEGTGHADFKVATSSVRTEGAPASYSADTLGVSAQETDPAAPTDSTSLPVLAPAQPHDSATTVELPPTLIPERAPWEISFLGGVFNSRSVYHSASSVDWAGGSSPARSSAFGAELMHMGRHLGLGLGLHWGSYAERLAVDAKYQKVTTISDYWTFTTYDTTILVITDTLPGAPPSYQGTSMDTVLSVFTHVIDTVTEEHKTRDARTMENRVSYLEVPLLADVHLVQGRWSLGVRGGPTVGLLTGRRGAMPSAVDDGYVPYRDQSFRELMIGYTARAYVRYRFNAGWSVGMEPALRGQFLNSLDNGTIDKRSHAIGLMIGLTYRFR